MSEQTKSPAQNPITGGETVTVACKLPSGLTLRLFSEVEVQLPVFGGGVRMAKEFHERSDAPRFTLNGWSHDQKVAPEHQIVGGFALTHGIPKAFWEEWLSQNKSSDIVKNGLIFAHVKEANTVAESREKKDIRAGFERLDPKNLPKQFKGVIETKAA